MQVNTFTDTVETNETTGTAYIWCNGVKNVLKVFVYSVNNVCVNFMVLSFIIKCVKGGSDAIHLVPEASSPSLYQDKYSWDDAGAFFVLVFKNVVIQVVNLLLCWFMSILQRYRDLYFSVLTAKQTFS